MADERPGDRTPLKSPIAVLFVLGVIGIAAPELGTEGEPQTARGWVYLIVGAVAGSLAVIGGLELALNAAWLRPVWGRIERPLRIVLFSALVVSLTVGCGVGVAAAVSVGQDLFRGCTAPTEVSVATDPENAGVARRLAEEFERNAAEDDGCAGVNLTVYDASAADVQAALLEHWSPVDETDPESLHPLRDIGPRPDLWLPSSTVEVDRLPAEARGRTLPIARASVYAGSRPVIGVSPQAAVIAPPPDRSIGWHDARRLLREGKVPVPVIRPDGGVSAAGRLAAATMVRAPDPRTGQPVNGGTMRQIELDLAASARAAGYPLGNAGAVLGRYAERSCNETQHLAAVLLPRHLVAHPELVGVSLADRPWDTCLTEEDRALRTIDPADSRDVGLPAVVLAWEHPAGPSTAADKAEAFRRWLLSHAGQEAAQALGLEPRDRMERTGSERFDVTGASHAMDPGLLTDVDQALTVQQRASERTRMLIALDTSLSMSTALPAATVAVDDLLDRLGENDEVGLLTFGRDFDPGRDPRVPLGPAGSPLQRDAHRQQVLTAMGRERPGGQTPLWPAVTAGTGVLDGAPAGSGLDQVLVVVTDGAIPAGPADAALVARDEGTRPRVVLLAIGGRSCSAPLLAVTAGLGGSVCVTSVGDAAAAIWREG